jgi:hypothetical protein
MILDTVIQAAAEVAVVVLVLMVDKVVPLTIAQ